MSVIGLQGVSKSFGAAPVVDDVTLDFASVTRTAIVGASGSGKTTVLRLLSGFENPDSGTITLGDRVLAGAGTWVPAHRRGIGHVSQDGSLFPQLTVAQNVAFGLRGMPRSHRSSAVAELLELVSIDPGFADRRPDELSGGQQQRIALARALARRPRVMLLDEPFSALDTGLRAATRDLVATTLESAGITTILVTHDREEALSFADTVAVIRAGRLVQVGPPRELYEHPVDLFTAEFLGDCVVVDGVVTGDRALCTFGTVGLRGGGPTGAASIMFRHEQLRAAAVDSGGVGIVDEREFQGAEVVLSVRLDSGQAIRLRQPAAIGIEPDDRVAIAVDGGAIAYPLVAGR